jgi:metal-responsive CopG/Arc/MetJ family transcriptional regulator
MEVSVNILSQFLQTFDRFLNQRQILSREAILAEAASTEDLEYRLRRLDAKASHPVLYL